jgi:hypothetical protein
MKSEAGDRRSTFVTVLAWIAIIFAGFGSFGSLMQNLLFLQVAPMEEMQAAANPDQLQEMPLFARLMFRHFHLYLLGMLAVMLLMLAAAIGLLKRRNWARKIFMGMMGLGIVFVLLGFGSQLAFDPMRQGVNPEQVPREVVNMIYMMQVFMFIFVAAVVSLFGWIIKKLASPAVRSEFVGTGG